MLGFRLEVATARSKRHRKAATVVATPADQSSKSGLRTRRNAAAWSTCLRALLLNPHHQPVAAAELHDRARCERVLARVRVDALAAGAIVRDDLVRDSQAGTSAGQPDGATPR